MKRIITILLCVLTIWSVSAAGYNRLTVELKDGSNVNVDLTENVSMSFTAEDLRFAGTATEVTIPRADIKSFSHSEVSGVSDISSSELRMSREGNLISFTNVPVGSRISLVSLGGETIVSDTACCEYTLSLEGLQPGAYVVTVNNTSFKILVK